MSVIGKQCPLIDTLQFVKGDAVKIPGTAGPIIVEFWASWCGPCRQVFPHLSAIASKFKAKGLRVVGVCLEPDSPQMRKFVADQGANMSYSVAVDPQGQAQALMVEAGQSGIPCAFVIDRDGIIQFVGHPGSPQFTSAVEKACTAAAAPEALPLITLTKQELMAKPVKELKQILQERKITAADLYEKVELVDRIMQKCANITYYK